MEIIILLLLAGGVIYFLKRNPQIVANVGKGISEAMNGLSTPSQFSPASGPGAASSQRDPPSTPRSDGLTAETGASAEPPYAGESATGEAADALVPRETPSTLPVPVIPASGSPKGMHLKLRRAQRSGVMGKVIFSLDARIEPSAEQLALIRKYGLGKMVVYDSEARQRNASAAAAHMDSAAGAASATPYTAAGAAMSIASTLWRASKGAARAVATAF